MKNLKKMIQVQTGETYEYIDRSLKHTSDGLLVQTEYARVKDFDEQGYELDKYIPLENIVREWCEEK